MANTVFWLFRPRKFPNDANVFMEKVKVFHSTIKPYLLNSVIPRVSKKVFDNLATYKLNDHHVKLPFIDLLNSNAAASLKVHDEISSAIDNHETDDSFIAWLKFDLEKNIFDNPTFRLQSVSHAGNIHVSISTYFQTLSSSDKVYYSLINNYPYKDISKASALSYNCGVVVHNWIDSIKKILSDKSFSHYSASIGCSVLTVIQKDNDYRYLIITNSNLKNSMEDKHVIPSFMFQPVSSSPDEQKCELDLQLSVLREFGEELLNIEELARADLVDVLMDEIGKNAYLDYIKTMLAEGAADLIITGLVLDIFRMRPEITLLLIIREDEFLKIIEKNWESKKIDSFSLFDEESYLNLLRDNDCPLCAPGIASLIKGRSKALELLQ